MTRAMGSDSQGTIDITKAGNAMSPLVHLSQADSQVNTATPRIQLGPVDYPPEKTMGFAVIPR